MSFMQVGSTEASVYQLSQMLRASREKTTIQIQETNQQIEAGKNAVQRNAQVANPSSGEPGAVLDLYA
jgi:hypothetical protein